MKLLMENWRKYLKEAITDEWGRELPSKEDWLKILDKPEIKDFLDVDTPPEDIEQYAEELVNWEAELKDFNTQAEVHLTYEDFLKEFENVGISMNNAKVIAQHLQILAAKERGGIEAPIAEASEDVREYVAYVEIPYEGWAKETGETIEDVKEEAEMFPNSEIAIMLDPDGRLVPEESKSYGIADYDEEELADEVARIEKCIESGERDCY